MNRIDKIADTVHLLVNVKLISIKARALRNIANEFREVRSAKYSPDSFRIDVRIEGSEELSQRLCLHFIIHFLNI